MAFGEPKIESKTENKYIMLLADILSPYWDNKLFPPQEWLLWEMVLVLESSWLKRQFEYLIAHTEVLGWTGHLKTKSRGMHL